MKCGSHDTMLDHEGICSTCLSFKRELETVERRRTRILLTIVREAVNEKCHWAEIEDAQRLAELLNIEAKEIEWEIRRFQFRHEDPLIALSTNDKRLVAKMEERGLTLLRNESGPYRQGFTVYKRKGVPGNIRVNYECAFVDLGDDEDDVFDAPLGWLYPEADGSWIFTVCVFVPSGPGDFSNCHDTLEAAVEDVLDYYFGDPERMNPIEYIVRLKKQAEQSLKQDLPQQEL